MTEREILDDKYALVRHIAAGPNGDVYEAEHLLLGKRVAIKRLKPGLASDGALPSDLLRALRRLAQIDHPNLASLIDIGTTDSSVFVVSEMLSGRTLLQEVQERGPLGVAEASDFIVQVLAALEFAHGQDATHGALHPNNVLVVYPRPGVPWVKVTDLGLRGALPDQCPWQAPLPDLSSFLSPTARASGRASEPCDDVYSAAALLHALVHGEPPPMSAQDLSRSSSLPPALQELIADGLAAHAAARPQSAQEFMQRLSPFALQPPIAQPRGSLPPSLRWFEEQSTPYSVRIRSSPPRSESPADNGSRDSALTDSLLRNPRFPGAPDSGWGERLRSVKARYEERSGLGAAWVFAIASILAGVACALIAAALN